MAQQPMAHQAVLADLIQRGPSIGASVEPFNALAVGGASGRAEEPVTRRKPNGRGPSGMPAPDPDPLNRIGISRGHKGGSAMA